MGGARGKRARPKLLALCAALAVAATVLISQTGVTGAEKQDPAQFSVAGDGGLPTKRPELGDNRDPLSTEETGYAIHLASTADSIPRGATNVRGKAGPEYLYAALPDDVDSTGRTALVALYDYTDNVAYHQLVDLKTGNVSSKRARGLQPPPSPDEAEVAATIALRAQPSTRFAKQFERSEGVPLISPDQISFVAGAWTYGESIPAGRQCTRERCVHLIVKTATGTYLDTTDFVVDLSSRQVVRLKDEP